MAMTTRTQLIEAVDHYSASRTSNLTRLKSCKAWFYRIEIEDQLYTVLQSYATPVALYSPRTGTVYSFDRYSATTTQHLHKFAQLMEASRITKLYRDSTRCVEVALNEYANTVKLTAAQWRTVIGNDFQGYIETISREVAE